MHVVASVSYLIGEQVCKGFAVGHPVVIAILLVSQERVRGLARGVWVNVVLL